MSAVKFFYGAAIFKNTSVTVLFNRNFLINYERRIITTGRFTPILLCIYKMKRIISALLIAILSFSAAGCGSERD